MTMETLTQRLVDVLVPRLAAPEMRMEQRLLLLGVGFGRSIGTTKNRTAHIRWWAKRVGRPGVVPANGELRIANREYVTNDPSSSARKIYLYQYVER